jgi:CheY-like chemotaxis protein
MPTILLVDDSATDRRMIGGILERHGFAVRFAENGAGAIKQLRRACPDAVVTDMQMPGMDGLELVKFMRGAFADVPVILMTGHGSESLAAQALHHGAASYVPKSQINKLLVDSVKHVLELARGDTNFRRLIDHTRITDFHFELPNDQELIEPLLTLIQQMIAGMDLLDAAARLQVEVALEQAILNAMYHGNLELSSAELRADRQRAADAQGGTNPNAEGSEGAEPAPTLIEQRRHTEPYCQRKVLVRALINREEARFVVRDEGHGFDVQSCLDVSLSDDENAGRGLVLMWALMDKVIYNKTGNEVTLIKRKPVRPGVAAAAAASKIDLPVKEVAGRTMPQKLGELVPLDGGRSIQLTQPRLSVGRNPSCDIVLPFSDVSNEHCLLYMYSGWWYVKDLKSANGTRLNRTLVDQKRIAPGAILMIATHQFEARYSPWDLGAEGITPPVDPF